MSYHEFIITVAICPWQGPCIFLYFLSFFLFNMINTTCFFGFLLSENADFQMGLMMMLFDIKCWHYSYHLTSTGSSLSFFHLCSLHQSA